MVSPAVCAKARFTASRSNEGGARSVRVVLARCARYMEITPNMLELTGIPGNQMEAVLDTSSKTGDQLKGALTVVAEEIGIKCAGLCYDCPTFAPLTKYPSDPEYTPGPDTTPNQISIDIAA